MARLSDFFDGIKIRHFRGSKYVVFENGEILSQRGKPLSPQEDNGGYLSVNLTLDEKRKKFMIHRLVAEMYIANPENKPWVNHIDGNKKNNWVTNLEWTTEKENIHHGYRLGLINPQRRERSKKIKMLKKKALPIEK